MSQVLKDFDLSSVWESDSRIDKNYKEAPFTPEILAVVESELGYKLLQSFIELMAVQSDGIFVRNRFPTTQRNSWVDNYVQVCEVSGVGFEKEGSLCGEMGQKLWLEEWEHPFIGVYFVDNPSGGHAPFALDYREYGKDGEPRIAFVEQESDFEIVELTSDFETLIRCLRCEDEFSGEQMQSRKEQVV